MRGRAVATTPTNTKAGADAQRLASIERRLDTLAAQVEALVAAHERQMNPPSAPPPSRPRPNRDLTAGMSMPNEALADFAHPDVLEILQQEALERRRR
jgi:hypothetical protein